MTGSAGTEASRVPLPGLSARAFEHPSDRAALAALSKVPGLDRVLRKALGLLGERSLYNLHLASSVRVTGTQFGRLGRLYAECLQILDVAPRPDLFVAQTPFVNAGAIGVDRPFIVLNSATLGLLDEGELRFILGHELGHVLAGHVLYKTLLIVLLRLASRNMGIPLGDLALFAVTAALLEWDRKSELSSDRAGLLCCQDPAIARRVFLKLSGGEQIAEMDPAEFARQAEEYRSAGTLVDSVHRLLNLLGMRHPFPVIRLSELERFVADGDYARILTGDYLRRDGEEQGLLEDFKQSAASYRSAFRESEEPFVVFLRGLGKRAREASGEVLSQLRGKRRDDKK